MSKIAEIYGVSTIKDIEWDDVLGRERCPFIGRKCIKTRKSEPHRSIGACTVSYGKNNDALIICPKRLLATNSIFTNCISLLKSHETGNELHVVSEIQIPGGSVDYMLVSTKKGRAVDFVGIELQTLDTTGSVWSERERFVKKHVPERPDEDREDKSFGINWKMTAKTILMQLHHKIATFEYVNRHLVLVLQNSLLNYMENEFNFDHLSSPSSIADSLHFHSYKIENDAESLDYYLQFDRHISTSSVGLNKALGLQADANIEMEDILKKLQVKISPQTQLIISANK